MNKWNKSFHKYQHINYDKRKGKNYWKMWNELSHTASVLSDCCVFSLLNFGHYMKKKTEMRLHQTIRQPSQMHIIMRQCAKNHVMPAKYDSRMIIFCMTLSMCAANSSSFTWCHSVDLFRRSHHLFIYKSCFYMLALQFSWQCLSYAFATHQRRLRLICTWIIFGWLSFRWGSPIFVSPACSCMRFTMCVCVCG